MNDICSIVITMELLIILKRRQYYKYQTKLYMGLVNVCANIPFSETSYASLPQKKCYLNKLQLLFYNYVYYINVY